MPSVTNSEKQPKNGKDVLDSGSGVRAFRPDDMPDVVQLMGKIFPRSPEETLNIKENILSELLMNNPWNDDRLPSLVYQDKEGKITGFLGVAPRSMEVNDQPVTAAVSYNLMVDPDSRSTLAGISLVKKFMEGPQDLSIADSATDTSRQLWERLGGITVPLYSMYWRHPLRPTGFVNHHLKNRRFLKTISRIATPLTRATDHVINRFWNGVWDDEGNKDYSIREVSAEELVGFITRFAERKALRPVYNKENLKWLLDLADKPARFGKLKKEAVFESNGTLAGWFIYYENPGGEAEVLQIQGEPGKKNQILTLLLQRAREQGAVGVAGRLDPEWATVVPNTAFCIYRPGRVWMLIDSGDVEILRLFKGGDAFITRIEGDMWLL